MKRNTFLNVILSFVILSIPVFVAPTLVGGSRGYVGIPQTDEAKLLQETIKKSYTIEAEAARTFDLTAFPSIFVNDQLGGDLSLSTVDFIRSVTGDYSSRNFGYLDYKIAYYTWWKSGALKFEALQTKALQENRNLTEEEIKSLIDEKGRVAMPRSQDIRTSVELQFVSIEVEEDEATVIFDDGLRTNQMVLVKINYQWYIAGNKFLSLHP